MSSINHAIAGSAAGMVAMVATYPLATLTTAKQASKKPKGLYAGLESAVVGIAAVNFLYYYVYSLIKSVLRRRGHKYLSVSQSLVTSVVAGVLSRIISNPIWVANTQMSVSNNNNNNSDDDKNSNGNTTLAVILSIYKRQGLKGLMSGLTPALVLVASPVIQFTLYEQIKNLLMRRRNGRPMNANMALVCGSLTKLIAILITYPYYTLRSRMHMDKTGTSLFGMTKAMYSNEGVKSFYGGLNAKLLQSVINAGVVFYLKEQTMKYLPK